MRWERLAFAAIAGAIGGYLLAKRQEPDIDWDDACDIWGEREAYMALVEQGLLTIGEDANMILVEPIPQCTCGRHD